MTKESWLVTYEKDSDALQAVHFLKRKFSSPSLSASPSSSVPPPLPHKSKSFNPRPAPHPIQTRDLGDNLRSKGSPNPYSCPTPNSNHENLLKMSKHALPPSHLKAEMSAEAQADKLKSGNPLKHQPVATTGSSNREQGPSRTFPQPHPANLYITPPNSNPQTPCFPSPTLSSPASLSKFSNSGSSPSILHPSKELPSRRHSGHHLSPASPAVQQHENAEILGPLSKEARQQRYQDRWSSDRQLGLGAKARSQTDSSVRFMPAYNAPEKKDEYEGEFNCYTMTQILEVFKSNPNPKIPESMKDPSLYVVLSNHITPQEVLNRHPIDRTIDLIDPEEEGEKKLSSRQLGIRSKNRSRGRKHSAGKFPQTSEEGVDTERDIDLEGFPTLTKSKSDPTMSTSCGEFPQDEAKPSPVTTSQPARPPALSSSKYPKNLTRSLHFSKDTPLTPSTDSLHRRRASEPPKVKDTNL